MRRIQLKREEGFTLIELGIVIAVIAILATVVLFGRGFIMASRVTKLVEAMGTVRKAASTYAGVIGGTLTASTTDEIPTLGNRQLLPVAAAPWNVSGTAFAVNQVRFQGATTGLNQVLIQYTADTPEHAQDVWNSVRIDPGYVATGATVGALVCTGATMPTVSGPVNVCFNI